MGYILTLYDNDINPIENINKYNSVIEYKPGTNRLFYFILTLSFFQVFYGVVTRGFSLMNLLDLASFLEMSNENSVNRYSGVDDASMIEKLLSINSVSCTFIGGFIFFKFKHRKKYLSYLSLLPPILSGLVYGAKMGIITACMMWISGYLTSSQLLKIKLSVNLKKIIIVIISLFVFLALMIIVMMFRIGQFDVNTMFVVLGKSTSYILAHLPAFDLWYSSHTENLIDLTLGGKLFYGITNALGIMNREGGVFTEMTVISIHGDSTNVYSVFRMLVEDFGTIGTFLYMLLLGSVCKYIFYMFKNHKSIYFYSSLLGLIYFFIFWSFVTSIFAYTTYIAVGVYIYIILHITICKSKKNGLSSIKQNVSFRC